MLQGAPRKKLPIIVPIRPTVRRMLSGGDDGGISDGTQSISSVATRKTDRCLEYLYSRTHLSETEIPTLCCNWDTGMLNKI